MSVNRLMRTPDTFPSARLMSTDFDGTVAQTFDLPPNGLGVHEAYDQAIEQLFGTAIFASYVKKGGLKNRAPVEVIKDLAPDADSNELVALTDQLTELKLNMLISQIGERLPNGNTWPQPMPGYIELLECILHAHEQSGLVIDNAIISSGHDSFIRKTYQAWGVNEPDIVIASEVVSEFSDLPPEHLVKPSPILMDITLRQWESMYDARTSAANERGRIVYVGDDKEKDGMLAVNSSVRFFHIANVTESIRTWQKIGLHLGIGHIAIPGAMNESE